MALFKADQVTGRNPLLNADGANDLVPLFGDFTVPAGLAAGDVVEMVGLPAGYVPVDLLIDNDALGATFTANVGFLTGNYNAGGARTCGAEFNAGVNLATTGVKRPTAANATRIAPTKQSSHLDQVSGDRGIGFTVLAGLAGLVVGSKVRFTLLYRPQIEGK